MDLPTGAARPGWRVTAAMVGAGRTLADPRCAPDGGLVSFVASGGGAATLVTVPSGGGPEAVLAGVVPARRGGTAWLPSGEGLVVAGADGGLWLQSSSGAPAARLAGSLRGALSAPAVSPDGTEVAFVVDGRHVAVAPTDPDGAWPQRVSASADFCVDPTWSPDGEVVAWHEWDVPAMAWDDSRIAWCAPRGGACGVVASAGPPEAVAQPRFAPDGRIGALCDASGWLQVCAGPLAGPLTAVAGDDAEHGGPTWGSGQRTWAWSEDGSAVAFTRNVGGYGELCLVEVGGGEVAVVDRGVFDGVGWGGGRLVALRSGARTPEQVVVYPDPFAVLAAAGGSGPGGGSAGAGSAGAGSVRPRRAARVALARGPVAGIEAGAVEPEVVGWHGAEVQGVGSAVHGRLWRAPGSSPSDPGPLLVWVHGGPIGQHQVRWSSRGAWLLERGWSLLQVDPRGSTGWGRAYTQALTGCWGRLDVDDTVAGIEAALARGWGAPGQVAVMGASSAGLVALSVLARRPGLCQAGIDLYGVADLWSLQETTHRFEAHHIARMVGELPGAAAEWTDRSPITHAAAITDPLLVLYGSADPVVVPEQSERLIAALVARGAPVEQHRYDGEGHGWSRPSTVTDEVTRIDDFLTRHVLRGRRR